MRPIFSPKSSSLPEERPRVTTQRSVGNVRSDMQSLYSQATEMEILEEAYRIPSLHVSPGSQLSRTTLRQVRPASEHRRSMSHPFAALIHNKEGRKGASSSNFSEFTGKGVSSSAVISPSRPSGKREAGVLERDLMTGRCMTCDSTVRWPRELLVFRCTVCLTVNDLKPAAHSVTREDRDRMHFTKSSPSKPELDFLIKIEPLSAAKIKALAQQCMTEYLLGRLGHERVRKAGGNTPVMLPSRHCDANVKGLVPEEGKVRHLGCDKAQELEKITWRYELENPIENVGYNSGRFNHSTANEDKADSPGHDVPAMFLSDQKPFEDSQESHPMPAEILDKTRLRAARSFRKGYDGSKDIFKSLEEYISMSFASRECINSSFIASGPEGDIGVADEGTRQKPGASMDEVPQKTAGILSEMDAKTLLIGDIAENGSWWTGEGGLRKILDRSRPYYKHTSIQTSDVDTGIGGGLHKRSRIDWSELSEWYRVALCAGIDWKHCLSDLMELNEDEPLHEHLSARLIVEMENDILNAQERTKRVLLKATESLLKRPGGQPKEFKDVRFLLIILANPILYQSHSSSEDNQPKSPPKLDEHRNVGSLQLPMLVASPAYSQDRRNSPGQHSGIIKRVLGLLSNLPNNCHHHLVAWLGSYPENHFQRTTELIGRFVTYRLTRQHGKQIEKKQDPTADLVPNVSTSHRGASAALRAALDIPLQHSGRFNSKPKSVVYGDDWQLKAAARVMALLFSANNIGEASKGHVTGREKASHHRQILPTSSFYNTLLDYSDLIADFEAWESKRSKFAFCQYPFFLSIWAKIQIIEHDARRQMEVKAREAFFDSIMTRKAVNQYLVLRIRRECLVGDSLKGVSEVIGSGGEEIKKGLRIEFRGEEGIDAGGLRKEWFLLLVRDVFNPDHGMFIYDEDSHFCYFNPYSFETSDQFFLVGVVLGLAIYNSTILDVALPPFAFRKLLAAGPSAPGATSYVKPTMNYSLEDLAELRPSLANGLRQLLEYDGDVEGTFCRDFVADMERHGQVVQVPICSNGENTPVTNSNRREFVDLYIRYLLDTAVSRQFEPFKRGFFTVCGGNALSLFRPEEIELLIRGSDEPLDITSLRAVAVYENWGSQDSAGTEPIVGWFWDSFQSASPDDQRKLLSFITGSDRIPAMGAANLIIKLSCLGGDSLRFPVARTCFNMLSLWRYDSRQKLERMLWRAVHESEGFGLK